MLEYKLLHEKGTVYVRVLPEYGKIVVLSSIFILIGGGMFWCLLLIHILTFESLFLLSSLTQYQPAVSTLSSLDSGSEPSAFDVLSCEVKIVDSSWREKTT
jgi:hypothetical protein